MEERRQRLEAGLRQTPGLVVFSDSGPRLPNTTLFTVPGLAAETALIGFDLAGVAVSSGSACTSASLEPSYVLRALGVDEELAHTSLRIGFGRFTTEDEIDYAADRIIEAVQKLRNMSPLWEMAQEGIDIKSIKWAAH